MKNRTNVVLCFITLLIVSLVLQIGFASAAGSYVVQNGSRTMKITNITSHDKTMVISYEYRNTGSSAYSFSWSFTVTAYQGGIECDTPWFNTNHKNLNVDIKDGATLQVSEAFNLNDETTLVEITCGTWGFMLDKIYVYFNPVNQRWGSKEEVTSTATLRPDVTPKPEKNATQQNAVHDLNGDMTATWICPSCGKELNSKFCPDCGVTSPTPAPTPMPTSAPTEVPIDMSKPVENVVRAPYIVRYKYLSKDGQYTGETVDQFPHGYGLFESDEWFYIGNWEKGLPVADGDLYFRDQQTVDSFEKYKKYFENEDIAVKVGDIITFGSYEQDNDLENGPEPIEWLVLDMQDGTALLLSKYGLDAKPYNLKNIPITWEACTLRHWLNSDFLNAAFSGKEKTKILTTAVDNSASQGYSKWRVDGGNNTQDQIFLLSYAEAYRYLNVTYDNGKNLKSRVTPTAYAKAQGTYTNQTMDGSEVGWWWLRSPGESKFYAAVVYLGGQLLNMYVHFDNAVVRPALWVNLSSGLSTVESR